jgi:hypothetical protein
LITSLIFDFIRYGTGNRVWSFVGFYMPSRHLLNVAMAFPSREGTRFPFT